MRDMNFLIACDQRIAAYIPALICSICENHRDTQANFYIMHRKIDKQTMNFIDKTANKYNAAVYEIVPPNGAFDLFVKDMDAAHGNHRFPEETYYHLLAHLYLPVNIDRILYLDVDITINGDIKPFYFCDFKGKYVAVADRYGTIATRYGSRRNPNLPIYRFGGNRFNSGVILYNLRKMRESIDENFYRKIIRSFKREGVLHQVCWDEGIANFVFHDKAIYFDDIYNSVFEMRKPAVILHAGAHPFKPWTYRLGKNAKFEEMCYKRIAWRRIWTQAAKPINPIWWRYALLASNGKEILAQAEENIRICKQSGGDPQTSAEERKGTAKRSKTPRAPSGYPEAPQAISIWSGDSVHAAPERMGRRPIPAKQNKKIRPIAALGGNRVRTSKVNNRTPEGAPDIAYSFEAWLNKMKDQNR
jgi:lipopolysaccharide biosynthesis glycosyltransferase